MSSDHPAPIPVLSAHGGSRAAFLALALVIGGGAALGARAVESLVLQVVIGLWWALAGLAAFGAVLSRAWSRSLRELTSQAESHQREACSRRLALASQAVAAVARGEPPPPIPEAEGELGGLRPELAALAESAARWNRDLDAIVAAVLAGRLDQRADPSGYQGHHARVLKGFNTVLDALIAPLQASAMYVNRLSRGDVPAPLTDAWPGELDFLRTNLNACSAGLGAVFRDLIEMTRSRPLRRRSCPRRRRSWRRWWDRSGWSSTRPPHRTRATPRRGRSRAAPERAADPARSAPTSRPAAFTWSACPTTRTLRL